MFQFAALFAEFSEGQKLFWFVMLMFALSGAGLKKMLGK